jgi:hypothetical protein
VLLHIILEAQVVTLDEELDAANAAKAAIDTLSTTTPSPFIAATLRNAREVATRAMTFLGDGPLNDARDKIGIELSILINALENAPLKAMRSPTARKNFHTDASKVLYNSEAVVYRKREKIVTGRPASQCSTKGGTSSPPGTLRLIEGMSCTSWPT